MAVAPDSSYLWVSEGSNNRVLRIRNPLTVPVVDCILGQNSKDAVLSNRGGAMGLNTLFYPGELALDKEGNLFVGDHAGEGSGNCRMLVFLASTIPAGKTAMIYGPNADREYPRAFGSKGIAFDSQGRMVVGFDPYVSGPPPAGQHFPALYRNPLTPQAASDDHVLDYFTAGYSVAFDADDNLYVGDNTRSRVVVYWEPFGMAPVPPPPPPPPPPLPVDPTTLTRTEAQKIGQQVTKALTTRKASAGVDVFRYVYKGKGWPWPEGL